MTLQTDGKALVYLFEGDSSQTLSRVVRINANGTLDALFNANAQIGLSSNTTGQIFEPYKMIQQADGKILLGGINFDFSQETTQKALFRLNSDGTPDTTFGTNGLLSLGTFDLEYIGDIGIQNTGKIIALVGTFDYNIVPIAYFIRLLNNLNVGVLERATLNELGLYPNPVQGSFELSYELTEATPIQVDLLDIQGRIVHTLQTTQLENGQQTHRFEFPVNMATGTYTVSIISGNSVRNNLQILVK